MKLDIGVGITILAVKTAKYSNYFTQTGIIDLSHTMPCAMWISLYIMIY